MSDDEQYNVCSVIISEAAPETDAAFSHLRCVGVLPPPSGCQSDLRLSLILVADALDTCRFDCSNTERPKYEKQSHKVLK